MRVQILLMWGVVGDLSTRKQAEGKGEEEATFARATTGRGHVKQVLCHKGNSSSLMKCPPRGEGRWLCQLTTGAIPAGIVPLCQQGGIHRDPPSPEAHSLLQQTGITSTIPHRVSRQPPGKAERRRCLQIPSSFIQF